MKLLVNKSDANNLRSYLGKFIDAMCLVTCHIKKNRLFKIFSQYVDDTSTVPPTNLCTWLLETYNNPGENKL